MKLKNVEKIDLRMTLYKHVFSGGRPSYLQGSWQLWKGSGTIANGNLMVFKNREIIPELQRQVQYFFENAI